MKEKLSPGTVYDCPICSVGLPLKNMKHHIEDHVENNYGCINKNNRAKIHNVLKIIKDIDKSSDLKIKKRKKKAKRIHNPKGSVMSGLGGKTSSANWNKTK